MHAVDILAVASKPWTSPGFSGGGWLVVQTSPACGYWASCSVPAYKAHSFPALSGLVEQLCPALILPDCSPLSPRSWGFFRSCLVPCPKLPTSVAGFLSPCSCLAGTGPPFTPRTQRLSPLSKTRLAVWCSRSWGAWMFRASRRNSFQPETPYLQL